MDDYAAAIAGAAARVPGPVAVCGWSMGGLAAMMAARETQPDHLVLLEPSPPAEIQGSDETVELAGGTFYPEDAYGAFPPGMRSRPESTLARAERKGGISVPSLARRTLVVYGRDFPDDRGHRLAARYGADELELPDLDHWSLVLDERVPTAIASWLRTPQEFVAQSHKLR